MLSYSDDDFEYLRDRLIAQERQAYENALRAPATLIDLNIRAEDLPRECQALPAAIFDAYKQRTGEEMPPGKYTPVEIVGKR